MAGWLLAWLVGWLVGLLAVSTTKLGVENRPSWLSKSLSWRPKSSKIGPKRPPGGVLGVPRGLLEGSWGALGPKRAPRAKKYQKVKIGYASWGPSWSPKSIKNRSRCDPKGDHFFD